MKKYLMMVCSVVLVFSLMACGKKDNESVVEPEKSHQISGAEEVNSSNAHLIGTEIIDDSPLSSYQEGVALDENSADSGLLEGNSIVRDVSSECELAPRSITNIIAIDGNTPEVILDNGSAVLFTKGGNQGWVCKPGDKIIFEFEKYESNVIEKQKIVVGYAVNGTLYQGKEVIEEKGLFELNIESNGEYYIYIISATSDYLTMKKGTIYVTEKQDGA